MITDMAWFFEALATRNSQDAIGPAEPETTRFGRRPNRKRQRKPWMWSVSGRTRGPDSGSPRTRNSTASFANASWVCTRRQPAASSQAGSPRLMARWACSCCSTNFRAMPFAARRACTTPTPWHARWRRPRSLPAMTGKCPSSSGSSSIFRSAIPKTWPTRIVRLRSASHWASRRLGHAEHHRDIVRRFGRFPHRNAILGREPRPEEQRFLDEGGFAG